MDNRRLNGFDDAQDFDALLRASVADPVVPTDTFAMRERIIAASREPTTPPHRAAPARRLSSFRPAYAFGALAVLAALSFTLVRPFASTESIASRAGERSAGSMDMFSAEQAPAGAAAPESAAMSDEAMAQDGAAASSSPQAGTVGPVRHVDDLVGRPVLEALSWAKEAGFVAQVIDATDVARSGSDARVPETVDVVFVVTDAVVVAVLDPSSNP